MPSYRVCGDSDYNGHAPGSVFSAEADDAIERAVERGSIAPADVAPPPEDATPPTEAIVKEVVKKLNIESHRGS